ncbi:TRAP transporter substrate-binding protein [Rhodospirillum sp. A1_3_36]|uniref:TRAP transporter substrate-binding protein n=1 Tax=Rhodospirillum sp. A1_3_36 TaxID=3391666 RepID=UPI0039A6DDEC
MKITRRSLGLLALSAGLALSGVAQAKTVIHLAHHLPETSEQHLAATRMAELVKERSHGELEMQVLPSGQVGGQREIIEGVQMGTIEMGYGESGLYANYVPAFGILTLPYLYTGPAHWAKVVEGDIGSSLVKELEDKTGLVVLNWIQAGYRDTYTVDKKIEKPEDFAGLKIRVPESPVFVETFSALKAEPTPIPSPEIYTAMQTGVVSAMEGTPEVGYIQRMYEVAKHLNKTRHILFDGSFVTSRTFLDSLSEENRKIILDAAKEVAALQRKETGEREAAWFEKLSAAGMEIHEVDAAPFRAVLTPLQDRFAKDAGATEILADIRALAQ